MKPRDIVVAGNYCHDALVAKDGARRELGGSAAYISAVLRAARVDFAVAANVGDDFRYQGRVPPPRVVAGARTTSFVDDYRSGERVATLHAAAPPLQPEDLRERCTVGMAVAVAGEIPVATLLRLRELSRVLVADAQGFLRAFDPDGRVLHRAPAPEVLAALERADYFKASRGEAAVLDVARLRRTCTVIVTDGPGGCTLFAAGEEHHVPPFPARKVDPTGAGDCFLAGFAIGLLRGWPPLRAARLGNWCGARAVESHGVPHFDQLPELD